jgi:hypothetical protein
MKTTSIAFPFAELSLALLLACSGPSATGKSGGSEGGADGVVPDGTDGSGVVFTVAGCKADTCGAEATKCGWGNSDAKYLGCLSDCEVLGMLYLRCPETASTLYACASLGEKVDCTTGKGTGCDAEEQALASCLPIPDGGS